jgi:hypothetical protein
METLLRECEHTEKQSCFRPPRTHAESVQVVVYPPPPAPANPPVFIFQSLGILPGTHALPSSPPHAPPSRSHLRTSLGPGEKGREIWREKCARMSREGECRLDGPTRTQSSEKHILVKKHILVQENTLVKVNVDWTDPINSCAAPKSSRSKTAVCNCPSPRSRRILFCPALSFRS